MKWFQHQTAARNDEKICALFDILGHEGYAVYFLIIEIVAEKMDASPEAFCEFSTETWGRFTRLSGKKFAKFAQTLAELRLIFAQTSGEKIKITIPNLLKYRDNHTKNLQVTCKRPLKKEILNKFKEDFFNPPENIPSNPNLEKICAEHGLDLRTETAKFLSNARSKGLTSKNWQEALSYWLLNAPKFKATGKNGVAVAHPPNPNNKKELLINNFQFLGSKLGKDVRQYAEDFCNRKNLDEIPMCDVDSQFQQFLMGEILENLC